MIRILLVDDHAVVREGLRVLLAARPGLEVVAEAATPDEAVTAAVAVSPDVVVMDIGLGSDDGVPVIEAIRTRAPGARILVLTMYTDAETVRQSLLAGAAGYVVKGAGVRDLVDGVHAVAAGHSFLHSAIADVVVDDGLRWLRSGSHLSRREREVLSLLAGGDSARGIGQSLGISAHTVRRHLANVAAKLGIHGTRALSRYALEHGFARPIPLVHPPHPGDDPTS